MAFRILLVVFVSVVMMCSTCGFAVGQNETLLATSGKTSYKIFVKPNAENTVTNGAKQLSDYLYRVTGSNFQIERFSKESAAKKDVKSIFLGTVDDLSDFEILKRTDHSSVTTESIYIKVEKDGNIYIAGGSGRSTLYAVFQFLEDYVGCKWWSPTEESIPKKPRLVIPTGEENYTPPFYYRSHFVHNATSDAKFATILKENGYNQPISKEWGDRIDVVGWAHTFKDLIPVKTYFANHPEWFSDSRNEDRPATYRSETPTNNNYQLCLENESLFKEFLKNTLRWIRDVKSKRPEAYIFSISINDNDKYCRCDEAIKLIRSEGSPSASLLKFLNKLIVEIHKSYPDVKIQTLAYQKFLSAPKTIKPHKDIIIMVAPIDRAVNRSLTDSMNKDVFNQIMAWGNIGEQNFYWGYNTNFNHFLMPFSGLGNLQADFQTIAANNFQGVFLQDNNYTNGVGFFLDMQTWVIGKLMWNPTLDERMLMKEFMDNYYGSGGEYLYKYYMLLEESFNKSPSKNTSFSFDFSYVSDTILRQGNEFFCKALDVTKNDNIYHKRVLKEKFVLDYINLVMFRPKSDGNSLEKIDRFTTDLKNAGVKKIGINQNLEEMVNGGIQRLSAMSGIEISKNGDGFIIQEGQFSLDKRGEFTDIVEDRVASNGISATIDGKAKSWSIQIQPGRNANYLTANNVYRIQVDLKVTMNSNVKVPGNIELGLYNTASKKVKMKKLIDASKISQKKYNMFTVFESKIEVNDIIYISLKDAKVSKLYVDKFEFFNN